MDKINKQRELCKEAVKLIGEFSKEAGFINECQISHIQSTYSNGIITIFNNDGDNIQYSISEISYLFQDKIIDFWPLGNRFFFDVECLKASALKYYSHLDKIEFIEYIGNLHYTELRCNEIIQQLREIELATLNL
ncbi:MAG: hypothetical protein E6344_05965 [Clostridium sp.]|nr:hypothetical protein [Clostridium sp.]MDU7083219.1 hypothetical protein [Clostridium sp.]